ncbi:hypothetical protein GOM49_10410 [Clostridium bovifaecis]|uniref:Uncharacterized protein n=1 Tax=Clostridium bovifaecis TaxID=2184719 RepID=A0A6I6EWT8_9CLOT|nr:hypothetical protein GOM49_10410 [Clostridium bovifaecis]
MPIAWNFPSNNNSTITGISDAGIEAFKGSPYDSLAREICQNSLDACRDKSKAVKVEFHEFSIKVKDVPDSSNLYNALSNCFQYWKEYDNIKGQNFFKKALGLMNKGQVQILRISDYNTTGLDGAEKEVNSNWSNLIKGNGVSNKEGNAGGSFGIGKSAPFACSDLRTVFYSTLDIEGKRASQGVSRLTSFKYKDYTTLGVGYYGETEKNTPIMEMIKLDEDFLRNEPGTDIYILGFSKEFNWDIKILCAILDGFLVSIWRGLLEVKVNDVLLSKETLDNIFNTYYDYINENTRNYYEVLVSSNSNKTQWNFSGEGNVTLYLLQKEGFCRKVYMARKTGMKIFEQNRLSSFIQFAGILILEEDNINAIFKEMETPQHDKWEPNRASDKELANRYKKDLYREIKRLVNELQVISEDEALDIEGLGDYLTDDTVAADGDRGKKEGIENKINEVSISKVSIEKIKNGSFGTSKNSGEDGIIDIMGIEDENGEGQGVVNGGGESNDTSGGGKVSDVREDPKGKDNFQKEIKIQPISTRIFCSNKASNEYKLIFKLDRNVESGYIRFNIIGEQGEIEAEIIKAVNNNPQQSLKVKRNKVFVENLFKGIKNSITFNIHHDEYCTLGVGIYGFEK